VFCANTAVQYALADFIKIKDRYLKLGDFYQKKRDIFNSLMINSCFEFQPSLGTFFQLLSYKSITKEGDVEFAEKLTKEIGIASIPISVFYNDNTDNSVLRFCFAKKNETLEKAAEILQKL
jgi:methionine aminotransferase